MDDTTVMLLGGFITTWIQIIALYAKVSKMEGKMCGINTRINDLEKRLEYQTSRIDRIYNGRR